MNDKRYVKMFTSLAVSLELLPKSIIDTVKAISGSRKINYTDVYDKNIRKSALYLFQHSEEGCTANCAFCVQSIGKNKQRKKSKLVNYNLTKISITTLIEYLRNFDFRGKGIERICIQTVYTDHTVDYLVNLITELHAITDVPLTCCCIPISRESLVRLKESGLERITINYETATPELFTKIRGEERNAPYRWDIITTALEDAVEIFGHGRVGSHLQIGLGENQKEALGHIQTLTDKKILVSLFSFMPLANTSMEDYPRVNHKYYHQVQLGSYLIKSGISKFSRMKFNAEGKIVDYGIAGSDLINIIEKGTPFQNAGCPGCNRIDFDNNPGERFYSYPRNLTLSEVNLIRNEIMSNP